MKIIQHRLLCFSFLIIFFIPSGILTGQQTMATNAGISEERLERYDAFIESEIDREHIPGAVSLVLRNGKIVHRKAYGFSSHDERKDMRTDQIFFIQSMTKPIVSVAFMMLFEEGHFMLTDPVSRYLPEFKNLKVAKDPNAGASGSTEPANSEITIAQLLNHTAGFSHGLGGSELDRDILNALYFQPQQDISSRVNTLINLPMIGHPGEQWYYSASPDVLSLLIEHFSGMTTEQFLRERLFNPLGMYDTGYNLNESQNARAVKVHRINDEGVLENHPRQTPSQGNTVFGGTHGLFSTAPDYLKFCRMLLNNGEWNGRRFLSRKTIEFMTLDHTEALFPAPGLGFGLGFGITTDVADSKMLGSEGQYYWSGAYCTYFIIDPKEKMIAIFMTQMDQYTNFYGSKMRQFVYQAIAD